MTLRSALILLALATTLASCGRTTPTNPAAAAKPQPAAAIGRGVVDQDGGLIRLAAARDGALEQVLVQEGQAVTRGQVLAVFDRRSSGLSLTAARADIGDRRAQLRIAAAKLTGAERDAGRLRRLADQDAATRQEADQAAAAAVVARAELTQAEAALKGAGARADLQARDLAMLTVRAPSDGRVLSRTAVAGAYVAAGSPLFVLEPATPRVVRAEVDEAFADLVKPGLPATVTREFNEGRGYPAHVVRVSDMFGAAALNDPSAPRADTRVVQVIVAFDSPQPLKLGQRVLVRFGR